MSRRKVKWIYPRYFWVVEFSYPVRRAYWWSLRKDCNWVIVKAKNSEHARKICYKWYDPAHSNWWIMCMTPYANLNDERLAEKYSKWRRRPQRLNKFIDSVKKLLQRGK